MDSVNNAECPVCKHQYVVDPKQFGKAFSCKQCKQEVNLTVLSPNDPGASNDNESSDPSKANDWWLDEQDHLLLKWILKYEMSTNEDIQKGLSIYRNEKIAKKTIRLGGVLVKNGIISQNELELFDTFQDKSKITDMDRSFAALALKNKLVSIEQIKQAFQKQSDHFKKTKEIIVIGDILAKMGVMTPAYRDAILSRQQRLDVKYKDSSFGAVAIKMGLATRDQIDDALAIQQRLFSMTNKLQLLGNILEDNNILTDSQTRQILSHQKELKQQAEEKSTLENKTLKKKSQTIKTGETSKEMLPYINVQVSKDLLEATIFPTRPLPKSTTLDDILSILSDQNIKYGIVSHFHIRNYIKNPILQKKPWLIAKGKPPVPSVPASISYTFKNMIEDISFGSHRSTSHLAWQKWPKVKAGDILAERKPEKKGMPGISVHADIIDNEQHKYVELIGGTGTQLSDDGNQLTATHDGLVLSYMRNKICVLKEKQIQGDLTFFDEPFNWNGVLHVKGPINGKGLLRSFMIFANAVENIEIQVETDIIISGEINNAIIHAKGHVIAKNIINSTIQAYGHVVAEKNIEQSQVSSGGQVSVLAGKIIHSHIDAFQGIFSQSIESNKDKPSTLSVGLSNLVQGRIEKIQSQLPAYKHNLEKIGDALNDIKKTNPVIDENIKKLTNYIIACQSKKDAISNDTGSHVSDIEKKIITAQEAIQEKKQRLEKNKNRYQKYQKSYQQYFKQVKNLNDEHVALQEWMKNGHEPPGIMVSDTIKKGTRIVSPGCEMILDTDHSHIYIKEIQSNGSQRKLQLAQIADAPN